MTGHSSKNMMPDSMTGMVFAAEGIKNTVVLLNGPMGCKFYHSTTSQFLMVRPLLYLPSDSGEKVPVDYNYLNDWFFRQPRVPCTYLDGYDYVYGTADKVQEGLLYLRDAVEFELMVIINSPGASLIGDQLKELVNRVLPDRPCVVLESPGFSEDYDEGYEEAALEILQQVGPGTGGKGCNPCESALEDGTEFPIGNRETSRRKTVNILGISIWDRYFEGDRQEIIRMMELAGADVNCVLCAGCTLEEIRRMPRADLNVVVNARAGARCAAYLNEQFGTDTLICPALPIGFTASEQLAREICSRLGTDPGPLMAESERARARAWNKINDVYQNCGLPDGALFTVEGTAAQVCAYSTFFMDYLGMIPDCLAITGTVDRAMEGLLARLSLDTDAAEALHRDIRDTRAELVFADANTIAVLKTTDLRFCGIEINFPGMGYTDLIPKTHLGMNGALFLIEQVLNGLMSRL